jgi:hypothetical protein
MHYVRSEPGLPWNTRAHVMCNELMSKKAEINTWGDLRSKQTSIDVELDDRRFVKEALLTSDYQNIWEETVGDHQRKT